MLKLKQIVFFILPLIRPRTGYWIAKTLVLGGVGMVSTPWWLPFLSALIERVSDVNPPVEGISIAGFMLIVLGIGVYIFERTVELKGNRSVSVRAHFAVFDAEPFVERCFVKVANTSVDTPITITHIDYVGLHQIMPILNIRLPKRLEPSDITEVHIPVTNLPEPKKNEVLSRFRVTDSTGRQHYSSENTTVPPVGYVASG